MSTVISQVDRRNEVDLSGFPIEVKLVIGALHWSRAQMVERDDVHRTWDDYALKFNALAELLNQAGIRVELLREVVQAAQKVEELRTRDLMLQSLWGKEFEWVLNGKED